MKRGRKDHPNRPKHQSDLIALLNRFGSASKVGTYLGVSNRAVSNWMYEFDIEAKTTYQEKPITVRV